MDDNKFLRRALVLAKKGLYSAAPNPRVGCVICRDGEIIAEGWHKNTGGRHAEILALEKIHHRAAGATVYVNLEPCAHRGLTPPCADALVAARPSRVVVALPDPNPAVCGRGIAALRRAGVSVDLADSDGDIARRALLLNIGFYSRMLRRRPWVRLKIAATLDGKTALSNGQSRWISGEAARRDAHRLRARSCALITGIGTVLADNPHLTVRHVRVPRQPLRVLIDKDLRATKELNFFADDNFLVAAATPPTNFFAADNTVSLPDGEGGVDLQKLLRLLSERGANEVTVEAGRKLGASFLRQGLADEIALYVAPRVFGETAMGMFDLPSPPELRQATQFQRREILAFADGDIKLTYFADRALSSLNFDAAAQTGN